ncbi:MAG: hypothetical protein KGO82_20910, partial [Bacteroidota bacterium]|nr:hypothetical protein [Bacteroidota bacterium]
ATTGVEVVVVPLPPKRGGNDTGSTGTFTPYLKRLWYSAHVGSTHPLGSLNNVADANIYAMADLSYPVSSSFNLQLLAGIAQLTNTSSTTSVSPRWTHFSLNGQFIFPRVFDMKPYWRAGVGLYKDVAGTSTMGINTGFGGIVRLSNQFYLSPGLDLHLPRLQSKDERPYFLTAHIGILFK